MLTARHSLAAHQAAKPEDEVLESKPQNELLESKLEDEVLESKPQNELLDSKPRDDGRDFLAKAGCGMHAQGEIDRVAVFGNDYPTNDGTCVRDYIHVTDLAQAHALSLDYLRAGNSSTAINLGNGQGYSVLEVVEAAREVTGRDIVIEMQARRAGDPSHLVAGASKAGAVLHWRPQHPELADIISSAWKWHTKRRSAEA